MEEAIEDHYLSNDDAGSLDNSAAGSDENQKLAIETEVSSTTFIYAGTTQ